MYLRAERYNVNEERAKENGMDQFIRRITGSILVLLLAVSMAAAKDKKKDPDEIGNRDVGKGLNWYSLEKEIALGKQLAQDIERQAKIVDDPVIAE